MNSSLHWTIDTFLICYYFPYIPFLTVLKVGRVAQPMEVKNRAIIYRHVSCGEYVPAQQDETSKQGCMRDSSKFNMQQFNKHDAAAQVLSDSVTIDFAAV